MLINLLLFSIFAQDCNQSEQLIDQVLQNARKSDSVSQFLKNMEIPQEVLVGAKTSFSLQSSRPSADKYFASHYDPRIFIKTKCFVFTFTLFGDSLEVSLQNQKAELPLKGRQDLKSYFNTYSEGQLFLSIKNFSSENKFIKIEEILNYWDEKKFKGEKKIPYNFVFDSKKCGQCHVTSDNPGARAFGLKEINVEDTKLLAVISPYYDNPKSSSLEGEFYCVPKDLQFLENCLCSPNKPVSCQVLRELKTPPTQKELKLACEKLRSVNDLNPKQDPRYRGIKKCLSD